MQTSLARNRAVANKRKKSTVPEIKHMGMVLCLQTVISAEALSIAQVGWKKKLRGGGFFMKPVETGCWKPKMPHQLFNMGFFYESNRLKKCN